MGDPYTGDPAQEQQGLNSVFAKDKSTLKVIREEIRLIKKKKAYRINKDIEGSKKAAVEVQQLLYYVQRS